MVSVKTPINTDDIKERAASKLRLFSANKSTKREKRVTGDMVKPIHVSKSDPLVKRITNSQKIN